MLNEHRIHLHVYGIRNCDTVRATLKWLETRNVPYTFHDLRAELFGLSSWNNSLLLREAGASMEQAVMPSEVALIPESRRQRF